MMAWGFAMAEVSEVRLAALLDEAIARDLAFEYTGYWQLLEACRAFGDIERATSIKEQMKRYGVEPTRAEARAWIVPSGNTNDATTVEMPIAAPRYVNGWDDEALSARVLALVRRCEESRIYSLQRNALPYLATLNLDAQDAERSLHHHAEKKALADLAARAPQDGSTLEVSVNFRMCVDCHLFFEAAAVVLARRLECFDQNTRHVFDPEIGGCSCSVGGAAWRAPLHPRRMPAAGL